MPRKSSSESDPIEFSRIRILPTGFIPNPERLTIVQLPGLGASAENLLLVHRALVDECNLQAVVLEAPGAGLDTKTALISASAQAVIRSGVLGAGPKVYVGNSAGLAMAIELAKADPQTVALVSFVGLLDFLSDFLSHPLRHFWKEPAKVARLLILLMLVTLPWPDFAFQPFRQPGRARGLLKPVFRDPQMLSPEAISALVDSNRNRSALRHLVHNRKYDLSSRGGEIHWPTLAIAGSDDALATDPSRSRFWMEAQAVLEELAQLLVLPGGHSLQVECPEAVAMAIRGFLQNQGII